MDRGMVAVPCADGAYIGWRLLASDPEDLSFNLYRVDDAAKSQPVRLNQAQLRQTTDFVDTAGPHATATSYLLRELRKGKETKGASCKVEACTKGAGAYRAISMPGVESIDLF